MAKDATRAGGGSAGTNGSKSHDSGDRSGEGAGEGEVAAPAQNGRHVANAAPTGGTGAPAGTGAALDPAKGTSKPGGDAAAPAGAPPLRSQAWSLCVLLLLYVLQGIPMGLAGAVPMLLQRNRGSADDATVYGWQGTFAMASWPYSIKLLWAPVVDAVWSRRFGRRKSWVVPVQLVCGAVMVAISGRVGDLIGEGGTEPQPRPLAMLYFGLFFLVATQDIAVDAWALTMLHKAHVGWASTCNTVGLTAGYMTSYVLFLALNSPDFSARVVEYTGWQAGTPGEPLVTLPGFMYVWGWAFIAATVAVAVFKSEAPVEESAEAAEEGDPASPKASVGARLVAAYREMLVVLKLRPVVLLIGTLLTVKVGFAATDAATSLEFTEIGVRQDVMALLTLVYLPFEIIIPFWVTRWTAGPRPLTVFITAFPARIALDLLMAAVTAAAPPANDDGNLPLWFLGIAVTVGVAQRVTSIAMFVAQMAFFSRVADPAIGGTYITMLNTAANLGSKWTTVLVLPLIGWIGHDACYVPADGVDGGDALVRVPDRPCNRYGEADELCGDLGEEAQCLTVIDGYETMVVVCSALGALWYWLGAKRVLALQELPITAWRVGGTAEAKAQDKAARPHGD